MKNRTCLFPILLISSILFTFAGCANGSDDPSDSGGSKTDIWANAKAAIDAIDVSYEVYDSTQSSRAALGEITNEGESLDVAFYDYTSTVRTGIGIEQRSSYSNNILSGKTDTTQCILNMIKREIRNGIDSISFNKTFKKGVNFTEIAPTYDIDGNSMNVDLHTLYIVHESDSKQMYIYSKVEILVGTESNGYFYSVLKCTENTKGTLDTDLYMFGKASDVIRNWDYTRFDCTSTQKIKTRFHRDGKGYKWDSLTINSDGIKGYSYKDRSSKSESENYCIYLKGDYCAVYQKNQHETNTSYEKFASGENGKIIKHLSIDNNGTIGSWTYNLNFISELQSGTSGYKIKLESGSGQEGVYKLYKNDEPGVQVWRVDYNYDGVDVYTYVLPEDNMTGFTCSAASSIDPMVLVVENMTFKEADYVNTASFDTSLPEKLSEWITENQHEIEQILTYQSFP